jgi:biotin transport system substrate-specific component
LFNPGAELLPWAASPGWLRTAGIVLAGTALAAVCARVAVPLFFTPVPLTLAPFAVMLLGLLLPPRLAALTFAAYLAEGAMGLPVFAPGIGNGIAHLLGPTGGYLVAYPAAAALIAVLWRRARASSARGNWSYWPALGCAGLGALLILVSGAGWLAVTTHAGIPQLFSQAFLPFLPGDALKVAAAAAMATGLSRFRRVA